MDRMKRWFVYNDGLLTTFSTKDEAKAYADQCLAEYETNGTWSPDAAWLYWGRVEQDTVETKPGFELRDVR